MQFISCFFLWYGSSFLYNDFFNLSAMTIEELQKEFLLLPPDTIVTMFSWSDGEIYEVTEVKYDSSKNQIKLK